MMAKLTLAGGEALTIRNVALFVDGVGAAIDRGAGDAGAPARQDWPDSCEFTVPRRSSARLLYAARGEVELPSAEVLALTGFEVVRDSRGSPNVRIRSRVMRGGGARS